MKKPHVIVRRCDDYDMSAISAIINESVNDLKLKIPIQENVFIKPNVVTANKQYIFNSYTHPAVVEAMVTVLKDKSINNIIIGESGGYGIPSRLFLKEAGYFDLAEKLNVPVVDLNEHPVVKVKLAKAKWHKEIELSKYIAEANFKIWMPKLKYHIFASITNALKLNIGILTHKERMLYHDYRIHEKIVDLLEAGYPDLIVSDAIDITYGFESAPYPVRLGALILSNNPLACDVVASYIMNYRPQDVLHLQLAHERGYGSLQLKDINITGDISIDKLRAKPKGQRKLFQVLQELDTPLSFYSGYAPNTDIICDGGCEAAIKGCLGTIEKRRHGSLKKAKKGAIVTGIYKGDIVVPDGSVLLVGDCTKVDGKLVAKRVMRIKGCPIGARNLFIPVPLLFGLPSPMFDIRDAFLFIVNSIQKVFNIVKYRWVLKQ